MNFASTILEQLGGNRFLAMTGTKNLVKNTEKKTLTMKLIPNKSKAKWLKITLNSFDTYDMEFMGEKKTLNPEWAAAGIKIFDSTTVTIEKIEGAYDDMLQSVFTSVTGLYTRL